MSSILLQRRSVMFTLATASLVAACSDSSSSPDTTSGPGTGGSGGGSPDAGSHAEDAQLLNGLLADEYSALQAYGDAAPYLEKPDMTDPGAALAPVVLKVALHFSAQHTDHADALVKAIKAVGGTPISKSSVKYTLPKTFTASVTNIMKLAANAERGAAIVYNQTIEKLSPGTNRLLAAAISGDEAQHFMVLYALLQGIAAPGANLSASTANDVVPVSFVAGVGIGKSFEDLTDFSVSS